MKKILVCLFLTLAIAFVAVAADVTGKWSGSFTPEGGDAQPAYAVLKQSGTALAGTAGPDANAQWPGLHGSVKADKVSFQVTSPEDGTVYKCDLTLEGDHLKGDVVFTPSNGAPGKGKLDLARVKE